MAGTRFVLAGGALLAIVRRARRDDAEPRAWLVAVPVGALLFLCGNGFVVVAEQTLPSSVAAVVCATTPLVASGSRRFAASARAQSEIVGMVLGIAGVALLGIGSPLAVRRLARVSSSARADRLGARLAHRARRVREGERRGARPRRGGRADDHGRRLDAPHERRARRAPARARSRGERRSRGATSSCSARSSASRPTAGCSRNSRPAVAMSYAYVNPVIAVLLGAALGGEPLGWATLGATVLIGGGVMAAVVIGRKRPKR